MNMKSIKLIAATIILMATMNANATIDIHFGIFIKNVSIDQKNEVFTAEFYWWIKFPATNVTLNNELAKIEFVNAVKLEQQRIDSQNTNGYIYNQGLCKGTFTYSPNFANYPLDIQHLPIIIESLNMESNTVRLIPDKDAYNIDQTNGIDEGLKMTSYKMISAGFNEDSKVYNTTFGNNKNIKVSNYSRLTYTVDIKRNWMCYVLKIIIPNIILIFIAYLVFYIPSKDLEVAVGCTVTSLLCCIALQLIANDDLPSIGYITKSDIMYYITYSFLAGALIQTVVTYNLEKLDRSVFANKLERLGRKYYLLGYVIICAVAVSI